MSYHSNKMMRVNDETERGIHSARCPEEHAVRNEFRAPISGLRAVSLGLILSVLTIIYGQWMGIVFGANEDFIKDMLNNSATEVLASAYKGDEAEMKAVIDKSWRYMLRAHLHAGGMGTTAFAFILYLGLTRPTGWLTRVTGAALGAGGLGYSIYWMLAGFRAPGMGDTSAAKDSLEWLAVPSSGMFVIASLVVFGLMIAQLTRLSAGRRADPSVRPD